MNGDEPYGATPLTQAEIDGLIPTHITKRAELNELEQANILEAEIWNLSMSRRKTAAESIFLQELFSIAPDSGYCHLRSSQQ